MSKILVTGGAGFIGSALVKKLNSEGHQVVVLDSLLDQIHGLNPIETSATFKKIHGVCTFIKGDIRNREIVRQSLIDCDIVYHLAAETGTGQSMYRIANYCDVNIQGTAVLMEEIISQKKIKKVIVASSRAIYGEGQYSCKIHGVQYPEQRDEVLLSNGQYDPVCAECGKTLTCEATAENSKLYPLSIYATTKLAQENLVLQTARAHQISAFALRFQNVYGPGQSLSNPYTGILSIFTTRARTNKSIAIFEDGLESRDFVFIDDVVEALVLCLKHQEVAQLCAQQSTQQYALNIGSGIRTSVKDVVKIIMEYFSSSSVVSITGQYRAGDIRHNYANLKNAKSILNFQPKIDFKVGISIFLKWVESQDVTTDIYDQSLEELKERGLLKS